MIFCHLTQLAVYLALRTTLRVNNRRRDRWMHNEGQARDARDLDETAFRDMTDVENPNFRYVY